MKHDWSPARPAFLDFETQSEAELTTVSKYAGHPSTKALTCVVKTDDGVVHRMGPYLTAEDKLKLQRIAETHTLVAHNAPFDSAIWEKVLGLPEATWYDTLPPARAAGFPGKLDSISKIVTGRGKDPNGKRLIDLLCIVRNGKVVPANNPAYQLLLNYNERDVEELESIYNRVKGYGEPDVMTVDYKINERGVPIDRPMLEALGDLYSKNSELAEDEFDKLTDGVNPKSPKQLKEWLLAQGFPVAKTDKQTIRDLLADPEKFFVGDGEIDAAVSIIEDAWQYKQEIGRAGAGKVKRALAALDTDSRLRGQFVIYGAGPGRWAGRDMQLHNMPLAVKGFDARGLAPTMDAVRQAALDAAEGAGRKVATAEIANAMLRHTIRADNLNIADYNAVEARCLAWLADEKKMLEVFADRSRSIYLEMGKRIFGRPISKKEIQEYNLAKSLVLGCGYGMSGPKFAWTILRRAKISADSLKSIGLTPEQAVRVYRDEYPAIPQFWKDLHSAVHQCANGEDVKLRQLLFYRNGPDMHLKLPSGRDIVYRNTRVEMRIPGYCRLYGMPETPVPTVVYDSPRGGTNYLYGSKVCENACQGTCRDLLASSLVHWDQASFNPVLHVHDEGGSEDGSDRFHEFMEIMSAPRSWSTGFPVLVEGYCGPLWTKTPKGYTEAFYLDGKQVA